VQHSDAEQPAAAHVMSAGVALMVLATEEQSKATCIASEAAALMFAQDLDTCGSLLL